jgi:hypothetical protein
VIAVAIPFALMIHGALFYVARREIHSCISKIDINDIRVVIVKQLQVLDLIRNRHQKVTLRQGGIRVLLFHAAIFGAIEKITTLREFQSI